MTHCSQCKSTNSDECKALRFKVEIDPGDSCECACHGDEYSDLSEQDIAFRIEQLRRRSTRMMEEFEPEEIRFLLCLLARAR